MRPHAKDANDPLLGKNFIDQAIVNVDAAGVSACQITEEFFELRWILERIVGENRQQSLGFRFVSAGLELARVFQRLLRIDEPPGSS